MLGILVLREEDCAGYTGAQTVLGILVLRYCAGYTGAGVYWCYRLRFTVLGILVLRYAHCAILVLRYAHCAGHTGA